MKRFYLAILVLFAAADLASAVAPNVLHPGADLAARQAAAREAIRRREAQRRAAVSDKTKHEAYLRKLADQTADRQQALKGLNALRYSRRDEMRESSTNYGEVPFYRPSYSGFSPFLNYYGGFNSPGFYGGYYNAYSPFGGTGGYSYGTPFGFGMNYGYGWGAY